MCQDKSEYPEREQSWGNASELGQITDRDPGESHQYWMEGVERWERAWGINESTCSLVIKILCLMQWNI